MGGGGQQKMKLCGKFSPEQQTRGSDQRDTKKTGGGASVPLILPDTANFSLPANYYDALMFPDPLLTTI